MEFIEEIPEVTKSDWRECQNFGFEFMSDLDCYGAESALGRSSITIDCGTNVIVGLEFKKLWNWNK